MANLLAFFANGSEADVTGLPYNDGNFFNDTIIPKNSSMTTVSEVINYAIIVFGVLVITATILGNSLVILAIIRDRKLRRVGNIFIVNLAISDVLVGIIVTPLSLVHQISVQWPFGRHLCDFWISVDIICCTASILNLCVISYDRYNAISQPLKYAKHRTTKRAFVLVILVWLYSVGIALPPLLGWRKPKELQEVNKCHVTQDIGYTFYSTIGAFYLPLCIMVFFYARIFILTSHRGKQWVKGPGSSCRIQHRRSRKRRLSSSSTENTNNDVTGCIPCKTTHQQTRSRSRSRSRSTASQTDSRSRSTRNSSMTSSILRRSTQGHSSPSFSDAHRRAVMFSPRSSSAGTGDEVVLEITQGRRKQTIQRRRLCRQISNPTSDSSYTTSTTGTSSSTGTTETSFSDINISDIRTSRRASTVLHNLLAANVMAAEILQESVRGVKFTTRPRPGAILSSDDTDREPPIQEEESPSPRVARRKRKKISLPHERRAVKTLGIVVGCFIVCWLPFFVVTVIKPLCQKCSLENVVSGIVLWLGYCNSACNPVIYTFFNEDFRRAFRKLSLCRKSVSSPVYL